MSDFDQKFSVWRAEVLGARTIVASAERQSAAVGTNRGTTRVAEKPASLAERGPPADDDEQHQVILPPGSEEALALLYAERHASTLRYIAQWSRWKVFDGIKWSDDETLHAYDRVRAICREAAAGCGKPKVAAALASARTVSGVERLARSDRRVAATTEQWDADAWSLNTPGGVIDLRTGQLHPHEIEAYMTKATAVAPGGGCPLWEAHLRRVSGGDLELCKYHQRVFGYALTGITREHALFFQYGTGANGKSVTTNTIAGILGDYHRTASIETFIASGVERHPTDLASLRGARLVTSIETEEGRRWAESRIKALTGGDRIAARFMRQDFFEFAPQFKLLIAGNHKPGLRSVDESIRRRLHLIPFSQTIPTAERDETLGERLKAEWPGILAWMIQGCLEWQRIGLAPPHAVVSATAAYLEAEDAVAAWIEECCERDRVAWTVSGELYASWKKWAERLGEQPGSVKRFAQNLETRGFAPSRTRSARGYTGIRLQQMNLGGEA